MIREEIIRQQLYEKYIEPTKKNKKKYVGVEIEMPIVNLGKAAVDFEIVHRITKKFMEHFQFHEMGRDEDGNIYSAQNSSNGDILSYDCSYNNLELSLGRGKELNSLYQRFSEYYEYLQKEFSIYHYVLTGMGINPYRIYNRNVPIPTGRYRMLFHHLGSYKNYDLPMYFHEYPQYGTFSSASQVQLDVSYEDLLMTIKAFSKLEPIKALLFSNSVLMGEHEELLCCRDMFWENSTHGVNSHNIGMFDCELETIDDLMAYIESTSIYCVERGDKYINFPPIRIMDYFKQEFIVGEYFDHGVYREIKIKPQLSDIDYLRTFKFEDLTFRGTIEFRSVCCQPIRDCMTVAAFHLGLKNVLRELNDLLENDHILYHHGYTATELRRMFNRDKLPSFVNQDEVYQLAKKVVDLAKKGLQKRGFSEEKMLDPLYDRLEERMNPAKRMLSLKRQGIDMEDIILEYGKLA